MSTKSMAGLSKSSRSMSRVSSVRKCQPEINSGSAPSRWSGAGATVVMGLGVILPGCSREQAVTELAKGATKTFSPTVWFVVNGAGDVLINIAKAEMGQHVGTALARVVADELGADRS